MSYISLRRTFVLTIIAFIFTAVQSASAELPADCDARVTQAQNFSDFQRLLDTTNDTNADQTIKICLQAGVVVTNPAGGSVGALQISRSKIQVFAEANSGVKFVSLRTDGSQNEQSVFIASADTSGLRFSNFTIETSGNNGSALRFWQRSKVEELTNLTVKTNASGSSAAVNAIYVGGGSKIVKIDTLVLNQKPGANVFGLLVADASVDSIKSVFGNAFDQVASPAGSNDRVTTLYGTNATFGSIDGVFITEKNATDIAGNFFGSKISNINGAFVNGTGIGLSFSSESWVGSITNSKLESTLSTPLLFYSSKAEVIDDCELVTKANDKAGLNLSSSAIRGLRLVTIKAEGSSHPLGGNGVVAFTNSSIKWIINLAYSGPGRSVWKDSSSSVPNPGTCGDVVSSWQNNGSGCDMPVTCPPGSQAQGCSCVFSGCQPVVCNAGMLFDPAHCACVMSPGTPQQSRPPGR